MNRSIWRLLVFHLVGSTTYIACAAEPVAVAQSAGVTFHESAAVVDVYDLVEVTINVARPTVANPFTFARTGPGTAADGGPKSNVTRF